MSMDEATFTQRCRACAGRLYRLSYLILRSHADCEDALQEALIRAWTHRDKLRDESLFETWLVRILINESKRILKRRGERATSPLPPDAPARSPQDRALWDALAALPDAYRVVLLLHHMEGYTAAGTARIVGLPLTTVKWRLQEGKKRLRALLREEVPE